PRAAGRRGAGLRGRAARRRRAPARARRPQRLLVRRRDRRARAGRRARGPDRPAARGRALHLCLRGQQPAARPRAGQPRAGRGLHRGPAGARELRAGGGPQRPRSGVGQIPHRAAMTPHDVGRPTLAGAIAAAVGSACRLGGSSMRSTLSIPGRAPRRVALALPLLLAGCQSELFGGADTHADAVQKTDYAQQQIDQGPRKGDVWGPDQRDPCAEPVAAFCRDLSRQTGAAAHGVGCFPLVSTDLRTEAPWVSELGVNVADQIATGLGTGGASSTILDTDQLALRLSEQNLSRSSLTTLESIAAASPKLGVDRITFGTIRRRDKVGALDRD